MSLHKLATLKQIRVRNSAQNERGAALTSFVSPTLLTARSQDEHGSQGMHLLLTPCLRLQPILARSKGTAISKQAAGHVKGSKSFLLMSARHSHCTAGCETVVAALNFAACRL